MSTINFGIDLGTTNSAIAKYDKGLVEIFRNPLTLKHTIPSVVAFRNNRIIIGDKAKEILEKDPQNVIGGFKRKMGTNSTYTLAQLGKTISPEELSTFVLTELKQFIHSGEVPKAVVITIPASFDTIQSNATKKAGYGAGFEEVILLQEPIAASLAFANKEVDQLKNAKWLVYDLGGGTFDAAIVSIEEGEMKIVDHQGNNFLGGTDFDQAIIDHLIIPHLLEKGQFTDLRKAMKSASGAYNRLYNKLLFKAEEAKIVLSHAETAEIEFELTDEAGQLIEIYLVITRQQLQDIIAPFIGQTTKLLETLLEKNNLSKEDLEFILLVGGSTYIPAVRETLSNHFELTINTNIDPTTAVSIGAAYYAGMKRKTVLEELPQAITSNSGLSRNLEIKVAFEKFSQELEAPFLLSAIGDINDIFYRITRTDGGFDSGLKTLQKSITEYLPLVPQLHNVFELKLLDQYGNLIMTNQLPIIGIAHGKFNIDGQPLPNDICLAVDSIEEETSYLEPIFRKNSILPLKKTIIKEVSKHIKKGTDDTLIINVLEGPVDNLVIANHSIGYIKIDGYQLSRDLIIGSEVELTLEMSESRDLKVEVYLGLSDQVFENVFSSSGRAVDIPQVKQDLRDFRRGLLLKLQESEQREAFEQAAGLKKLMEEIELVLDRIDVLVTDDITDELYQIDEVRRTIAQQMHHFYRTTVLSKTLEMYFLVKRKTEISLMFSTDAEEEQKQFDQILEREKHFIKTDSVSIIRMKIHQIEAIFQKLQQRVEVTDKDIVAAFARFEKRAYQDQKAADEFIRIGRSALANSNYAELTFVINKLYDLKKEEEREDPDLFRSARTGLR